MIADGRPALASPSPHSLKVLAASVNFLNCRSAPYRLQIGLNLGTSYADDPKQTCLSPEKQILRNFYVDYFHSPSSCIAPDGTKVHVFKGKEHGSVSHGGSHSSMCARLPGICQMMQQYRARGILDDGWDVMSTLRNNFNHLYTLLTGQFSTAPFQPLDPQVLGTSMPRHHHNADDRIIDCRDNQCGDYSVPVCEGIEDVAFPVVGWSAINNHSVVILQEFPVLLQPVFFRKCKSSQSQVVHGRCIQEYLPVKFFVKPTYPGGSIAQDFVMVESGCQVAVDFNHRQWKGLPADGDSQPKIERKDVVERSRQSDRQLF
ncbi:uncharacterized protein LOC122262202 [Penaeus japonicus]|uniref:uncharacterized protein LOC122262202 n=1 Tax=Penaeus japonicus TaxID=27405 RepID=UPI001C711B7B|nr:uncharacterized protein LOC122262202 [Penaeus japonicus]